MTEIKGTASPFNNYQGAEEGTRPKQPPDDSSTSMLQLPDHHTGVPWWSRWLEPEGCWEVAAAAAVRSAPATYVDLSLG